eukprot:NODE_9314_length_265_cov_14.296296_g8573_i0.p2 GENE.NODE_9314_length_265_cov_14.296296_g8573_i0~~NODE_9314_length_265_cov_14.296296_g8573_i0.p2  ORF type:complete len:54 (-),score=6.87 NODE_9314_length_265_cov_14.296296_g8573_i0:14-175(-)
MYTQMRATSHNSPHVAIALCENGSTLYKRAACRTGEIALEVVGVPMLPPCTLR